MKNVHSGLKSKYFSMPAGVVTAKVCKCSGLLATEDCEHDPRGSQVYTEYFVKGTVPTEKCNCHVSVKICKETGLLANENCPDVETRVFITRPDADTNTNWQSPYVQDREYTLTIKDTCTKHVAPVIIEEPTKPVENQTKPDNNGNTTPGNTTTDGNTTTGGNTTPGNQTVENETPGNEIANNVTPGNEIPVNETIIQDGNTTP